MAAIDLAVLLLGFNRPDNISRHLDWFVRYPGSRIYLSVDGPRESNEQDGVARRAIERLLEEPRPYYLQTRLLEENLGTAQAVQSGISWFLSQEPEGIVLEDDCVPNESFIRFCRDGLGRYRDDRRVWMISGTNHLRRWHSRRLRGFFATPHIWGWATWADRWSHATLDALSGWERDAVALRRYWGAMWLYRRKLMIKTLNGELNSWAIPWLHVIARHGGLSLTPSVNLVTNVGRGGNATHTSGRSLFLDMPTFTMPDIDGPIAEVYMDSSYRDLVGVLMQAEDVAFQVGGAVKRAIR